jgi:hypothetical protein
VKAATCLFYSVATFFLGMISIPAGSPSMLAQIFRATPTEGNFGIVSYPSEPWLSIVLYGTVGLSAFFFVLALYFLATSQPTPNYHEPDGSNDEGA